MSFWFTEKHSENVRFSFKVKKQLFSEKSDYQQVDIFETYEFGRVLTLDGCVMVTEKDEFIYHEMIVHIPMMVNPNIKKVLIIGAGDGGTVRELTRYNTIENIHMVEIDKMVVDVCKEFLPQTACKLTDPRVTIFYEDGLKFVRSKQNEYDLIIVDSTDPFGPGEGLFTREFYKNCYSALVCDGTIVNQCDSIYYSSYDETLKRAFNKLNDIFPICKIYQAHIPTYPSGHWLFGYASKAFDPIKDFHIEYYNKMDLKMKYYNSDLHKGCFYLPNYVKEALNCE